MENLHCRGKSVWSEAHFIRDDFTPLDLDLGKLLTSGEVVIESLLMYGSSMPQIDHRGCEKSPVDGVSQQSVTLASAAVFDGH
jgi:hypothetical protein